MKRFLVSVNRAILGLQDLTKIDPKMVQEFVDIVRTGKGHLWVTGVGKSALVAQKFAATMASIGFQVTYISAQDFTHGDAGRIALHETVLFVSKSGNTEELRPALQLLGDTGIRALGVSLGAAEVETLLDVYCARHFKLGVEVTEGDKHDIIPTVSSCVLTAFLDGVAMELAELVINTKEQFTKIHTGGTIGKGNSNQDNKAN